jgi:hypothetical protein
MVAAEVRHAVAEIGFDIFLAALHLLVTVMR